MKKLRYIMEFTFDNIQVLPAELWDIIFRFLPTKDLVKAKLISSFFLELIESSKRFRVKILLCENKVDKLPTEEQFKWAIENWDFNTRKVPAKCRLEVLEWLYFNFSDEIMEKLDRKYMLEQAARCGDLDMLKYLYGIFNFTEKEIKDNSIDILYYWGTVGNFSEENQMEILKWLYYTFNLDRKIMIDWNPSLMWVVSWGQLKILQWIHEMFKLTVEEVNEKRFLMYAVSCSQLNVLTWVCDTFKLTKENIDINKFSI